MKGIRSILRLTHVHELSVRAVSERLKIGKTLFRLLLAREAGFVAGRPLDCDDDAALEGLQFRRVCRPPQNVNEPDWAMITRELKRYGVTPTLLWDVGEFEMRSVVGMMVGCCPFTVPAPHRLLS